MNSQNNVIQQAFTLAELSKRVQIPMNVLRIAIANGVLRGGNQTFRVGNLFYPIISREAAVEFCISIGLDPMRVAR